MADVNIDTAFIHTEDFFLLDRERVVRGWYNGFDSVMGIASLTSDGYYVIKAMNRQVFGKGSLSVPAREP